MPTLLAIILPELTSSIVHNRSRPDGSRIYPDLGSMLLDMADYSRARGVRNVLCADEPMSQTIGFVMEFAEGGYLEFRVALQTLRRTRPHHLWETAAGKVEIARTFAEATPENFEELDRALGKIPGPMTYLDHILAEDVCS